MTTVAVLLCGRVANVAAFLRAGLQCIVYSIINNL